MENYFGKKVTVNMDRPLGSKHPEFGFTYPINYGYIPDKKAADGEGINAYIVGEFEPLDTCEGYVIATVHEKNGLKDKLVVCKEKGKYVKEQVEAFIEFQERFFDSTVEMAEEHLQLEEPTTLTAYKTMRTVMIVLMAILFILDMTKNRRPYSLAILVTGSAAMQQYYIYKDNKDKYTLAAGIGAALLCIGCIIVYIIEYFGH
ncbi:MAG: DUF6442 family protein [bacterium]|nr:DUF6442 family protein [bacterium]